MKMAEKKKDLSTIDGKNLNRVNNHHTFDMKTSSLGDISEKIRNGELSPIAFYMKQCGIEMPALADYSGFNKSKVRKHLTLEGFSKLKTTELQKYELVFDISIDQLKTPDV